MLFIIYAVRLPVDPDVSERWYRSATYDAIAAELAQTQHDRQREHDLRVQAAGDAEALTAELTARDRTIANFDFEVCPKMASDP